MWWKILYLVLACSRPESLSVVCLFPGCPPWYGAEVQDSLCSLHIAQGGCPQGSEWIPVQRGGVRGPGGDWRSLLNAAGCSLAPCSAAWLQAAWRSPDLQARWGSCLNQRLRTGNRDTDLLVWERNLTKIYFLLPKISITLLERSQNIMLLSNADLHRLPRSHGVLWVPTTLWCAGAAPHQEAWEELHCEGREESKSISERGMRRCGSACARARPRLMLWGGSFITSAPDLSAANWLRSKPSFIRAIVMI